MSSRYTAVTLSGTLTQATHDRILTALYPLRTSFLQDPPLWMRTMMHEEPEPLFIGCSFQSPEAQELVRITRAAGLDMVWSLPWRARNVLALWSAGRRIAPLYWEGEELPLIPPHHRSSPQHLAWWPHVKAGWCHPRLRIGTNHQALDCAYQRIQTSPFIGLLRPASPRTKPAMGT